ncbi:MAG: hypothetical protein KBC21_00045 [Candidatus Pacebacteria bacterium]|nr:hypothetical protein [Candidatus Paceibacterota bacterium]
MKKTTTRLVSLGAVAFFATFMIAEAQVAYYYGNYGNNNTICTVDAYVCPNGTIVGRTGTNCQFSCSVVIVTPPIIDCDSWCMNHRTTSSYSYTSGCYTYYYNGQTRTTSIVSYSCQSQTQTYYPVATTYTYPSQVTQYPYHSSGYFTYMYCNGLWRPSYYGNNNCDNLSYRNNSNYYGVINYTSSYNNLNNCYYLNGYQICQ